jgi:hypothetical protein
MRAPPGIRFGGISFSQLPNCSCRNRPRFVRVVKWTGDYFGNLTKQLNSAFRHFFVWIEGERKGNSSTLVQCPLHFRFHEQTRAILPFRCDPLKTGKQHEARHPNKHRDSDAQCSQDYRHGSNRGVSVSTLNGKLLLRKFIFGLERIILRLGEYQFAK